MSATRLAVLGSPIAHSRSPLLHAAAYRVLGLDWSYEALEVGEAALAPFLASRDRTWRGLSLTMPLKAQAFALAQQRDQTARATGSVNTLLWDQQRQLLGFNTDVAGLVNALADAGVTGLDRMTVLGAGATAASALAAAAHLGAEEVQLLVRNPARGAGLTGQANALGLRLSIRSIAEPTDLASPLVVSTLPGGTELAAELPLELRQQALLFDVAYDPWPSAIARSWQRAGGRAVSGLGMLLHQALVQVRIFVFGDPLLPLPDEPAVLAAMRTALA